MFKETPRPNTAPQPNRDKNRDAQERAWLQELTGKSTPAAEQIPSVPEGFTEQDRDSLVMMATTDLFTVRPDIAKSMMLVEPAYKKLQTRLKIAFNTIANTGEKDQEKILRALKSSALDIGKQLTDVSNKQL